jgi:hypothetical protein
VLEVRWFAFVIREAEFDFRVRFRPRIDLAGTHGEVKSLAVSSHELAAEKEEGDEEGLHC